jgi:cytochrome P450
MPALGPETMQRNAAAICERVEDALDSWPLGVPFKLQEAMQAVTLRTTIEGLIGKRSPRIDAVARLYSAASRQFASPLILIPIELQERLRFGPWTRLVSLTRQAGQLFTDEIRERRTSAESGGSDVLSVLLMARDVDNQPMTDEELRDTLITFLVAGHDTTASALTWAFHCVLPDAALCARIKDELGQARDGGRLNAERVLSLPLLDATVRVVLRLRPIFPGVRRTLLRPMRLCGYDLPEGMSVAPSIYLAHRRPDVFAEPERFWPERFLDERPTPAEYLPFGGGMRRCVGGVSAPVQLKLGLATVLTRAVLRLVPAPPVRTVSAFISLAPEGGVPAVLVSRAPRSATA